MNGTNLYAYCMNNPLMDRDDSGYFVLSIFLIALASGAAIGAISGGMAAKEGERVKGAIIGGISGAVLGAAFGLGAGLGACAFYGQAAVSLTTGLLAFGATAAGATVAGMGIYALETVLYDKQYNSKAMWASGAGMGIRASINFGCGFLMGKQGFYSPRQILSSEGARAFVDRSIVRHGLCTPILWILDKIFQD